jgi:hypothetical protein
MKLEIAKLIMRFHHKNTTLEVNEELLFHIDMLERKYTQQGMSVAEAKAAARKRFGNLERIKQQCVDISKRNSLPQRILKTSAILIGLFGLLIRISSEEYKVARIGGLLIMIAIAGRLLLYVRGLSYRLPSPNERNLFQ